MQNIIYTLVYSFNFKKPEINENTPKELIEHIKNLEQVKTVSILNIETRHEKIWGRKFIEELENSIKFWGAISDKEKQKIFDRVILNVEKEKPNFFNEKENINGITLIKTDC